MVIIIKCIRDDSSKGLSIKYSYNIPIWTA